MDKARKEFLEKLNLKKKEFEQALQTLIENQKDYNEQFSSDNIKDESDHAQLEISVNSNYGLIERKIRELKDIDRQIRKVSRDEKFGRCEECGQAIPFERLLIVPEASLCIKCQRELEEIDHSRTLAARVLSRFKAEKAREWIYSSGFDDYEHDLIDSELDISQPFESDES